MISSTVNRPTLLEEALRRGADGVFVAADLDDGHAFEVALDALGRDGAADADRDAA
jgi:coenzyme F420-reducing hydrogenase delta subunit